MRLIRPAFVELRQYLIAPGRRERMVELFDTYFAAAQDALGLPILGQFEAVGDPSRLVWLRGFPDMASRPERLGAFYGGPVWSEFGPEAVGIVTAYDNVQLLREAAPGTGIEVDLDLRSSFGWRADDTRIMATTHCLAEPADPGLVELVRDQLGSRLLGLYVSESTPNNFPALPIREGEHLLTWFAAYDDTLQIEVPSAVPMTERLVLEPTPGSILR